MLSKDSLSAPFDAGEVVVIVTVAPEMRVLPLYVNTLAPFAVSLEETK